MIRFPAGYDSINRIKRYQDYYQASYGVMLLSAGQFSPLSLFAAGEQGAWYDPSDFSTMFQDAAGTTPVTAVEQPVGLLLDKSKGLALGAELVTNGTFTGVTNGTDVITLSGWSAYGTPTNRDIQSERFRIVATGSNQGAKLSFTVAAGKSYLFTCDYSGDGVSSVYCDTAAIADQEIKVSGSVRSVFRATGTTLNFYFRVNGNASGTGYYDNISVRELPGNHASQSTAASRPVLSARVNQLTFSEQFDNAAWTRNNANVTANATTAPNGTITADLLIPTTTNTGLHRVVNTTTVTASSVTHSIYAKAGGYSRIGIRESNSTGAAAVFELSNGTLVNTSNAGAITVSSTAIQSVGDGWYLISVKFADSGSTTQAIGIYNVSSSYTSGDPQATSFAGDGTSGIYIWGADLRVTNVGVNLPAYQRVAAATDYDTSGFPLYLKFDGVDDSLATGTLDPGAVDKAQVFAGYRRIASGGSLVMLSGSAANNGMFFVWAANNSTGLGDNWSFGSRGTINVSGLASGTYPAPLTNVVTAEFDISNDTLRARIDGTQRLNDTTTDQGTGNFLSYPIYVGRRNGTDLPVNGQVYSMIVRFGANLSDAQIASTETYVNNLTKAY